ncbi:hypothetical protein CSUB01_02994 [Colletotrichum sublineola]|uniref:Uncharacterized protein n=1 Tax=Colletotrichum sublineola TaxID=1173701 RepID=A0A066XM46_COLSU|nr:hypothetical protein CSUB01_02994 [Colletotrichum sublineola]
MSTFNPLPTEPDPKQGRPCYGGPGRSGARARHYAFPVSPASRTQQPSANAATSAPSTTFPPAAASSTFVRTPVASHHHHRSNTHRNPTNHGSPTQPALPPTIRVLFLLEARDLSPIDLLPSTTIHPREDILQ